MTNGQVQSTAGGVSTVPRAAAWAHAGLAGFIYSVVAWLLAASLEAIHHGCMDAFGGGILLWFMVLPLALIGLPVLIITVTLFRRSRRGALAALIYDTLLGIPTFIGLVAASGSYVYEGGGDLGETMMIVALIAIGALLIGTGIVLLLTGCYGWKRAWWGYAVFATLTLALVAWPPAANLGNIQHVRLLRNHLAVHVLRIPPATPVRVMRLDDANGHHREDVRFHCAEHCWIINADHEPDGWHLSTRAAWGMLTKENTPRIESESEARQLLRKMGVPEKELGDCTLTGSNYFFKVTAADHYFEVTRDLGVNFWLKQPLIIPDH